MSDITDRLSGQRGMIKSHPDFLDQYVSQHMYLYHWFRMASGFLVVDWIENHVSRQRQADSVGNVGNRRIQKQLEDLGGWPGD